MGLLFFLGGEGAYSKMGPAHDLDISGANALEAVLAARFRSGDLGRRPGCSQLSQTPTTVAHQTKEIAGQPVAFSAFSKVIHMPRPPNWYCRGAIHVRVCTGACVNMQVCVQVCLCTWRPVDTPDHCCTGTVCPSCFLKQGCSLT